MTGPRIYVACLAAYNNGCLHGRWIDASQTAEGIWSDIQAILAASPVPGAEEWAIHDFEGFGELRLSEWESVDRVVAIAAGIAEHGDAFAAWLSYDTSQDPADINRFEEMYRGEWDSLREYAEQWADDVGLYAAAEKAGSAYVTVDIEALERDLDIEMYTAFSEQGTVYVFDPSAS